MAISGSSHWRSRGGLASKHKIAGLVAAMGLTAAAGFTLALVTTRERLAAPLPNDAPQVVEATARVALLKTLGDRIEIEQLLAAYPADREIRAACGFLRQVEGGTLESFVATARPTGGWSIKLESQLGYDEMRGLWGATGCGDPIIPEVR